MLKMEVSFLEVEITNYTCGCVKREKGEWKHITFCYRHKKLGYIPQDQLAETPFIFSPQKEWFYIDKRNSCFSGGFGNGKTFIGCKKMITLCGRFPNSRGVITRARSKDLKHTTMKTFYQVCPKELYDERKGGYRKDSTGELKFVNGSEIIFMHFDDFQESALKSLEINFLLMDQAEEIAEEIYLPLNSRVGRWSGASVPDELIQQFPDWPKNPITGKPKVPSYSMILANPETKLHWIYNRFHPESEDFQQKYSKNTAPMVMASTRDNPTIDPEILEEMLTREPEWIAKYVDGIWGSSEGTIHIIKPESKLYVKKEFVDNLLQKSRLYRVLDHGDSSPTCCLWFAAFKNLHFCYREYYAPDKLISEHRKNIADLSGNEKYVGNYADPSIFHKEPAKKGGRWSIADEYLTRDYDSPPIPWSPADNNEFHTRNRINEFLKLHKDVIHPVASTSNSPLLYFIMRSEENLNGCYRVVLETESQKREKIGYVNGLAEFSEDRDDKIPDHAYDPLRYYIAIHSQAKKEAIPTARPGSFFHELRKAREWKREMELELEYA